MADKELIFNLDLARKNATRCVGYLERLQDKHEHDFADLLAEAMKLETAIKKTEEELGDG